MRITQCVIHTGCQTLFKTFPFALIFFLHTRKYFTLTLWVAHVGDKYEVYAKIVNVSDFGGKL